MDTFAPTVRLAPGQALGLDRDDSGRCWVLRLCPLTQLDARVAERRLNRAGKSVVQLMAGWREVAYAVAWRSGQPDILQLRLANGDPLDLSAERVTQLAIRASFKTGLQLDQLEIYQAEHKGRKAYGRLWLNNYQPSDAHSPQARTLITQPSQLFHF